MKIDLVYLWVDGNDSQWLARKNAFLGLDARITNDETNCKGRFVDNDELKFSLRSLEKHAPWINKVFIVTDAQIPTWLDTSCPKIQMVDHTEILPQAALPCYNSCVIEHYLYRIPGLSEHFLYANDDMFFNQEVMPSFFYAEDGFPVIRQTRKSFGKWHYSLETFFGKKLKPYAATLVKASLLVKEKFGKHYAGGPHHNMDAYRKSDYCAVTEQVFNQEIAACLSNHLRSSEDIQRIIFSYYALAIGHGHLKYVGRKEACNIPVNSPDFNKYLTQYHPTLFCLNDSQRVKDEDRKKIEPFLTALFPVKSAFEK
jgi:hypothetical protein